MIFSGTVQHGQAREGTLPTLNLDVQPKLDHGVYAVWVNWNAQRFMGAMNWGPQPTFNHDDPVVEIHLLEGEGDWYEREVEVEVVGQVRLVQKFSSKEALMEQVQMDLQKVKEILE